MGPGGEQVGVVRVEDALRLAEEAGLDLVEVAPNAKPPVAKLMDYGKYKYEAAQKARDARRNQANTQLKEIRFRLKIDDHDFGVKKGHVERFLSAGDKVKVSSARSSVVVKAMVTKRAQPLTVNGEETHMVWMPYSFGFKGLSTGPSTNYLTNDALDPNSEEQEFKACLVNVEKA